MARRRMLDPSFWDDESVGLLSNDARLLLICCISNADDEGRLPGSAAALKKICFGFTDVTTAQVEEWLIEIDSAVRKFHRYEVEGRSYIALLNWGRYQRVDHPQESSLPAPPGLPECETTRKRSGKKIRQAGSASRNGSDDSTNASRNGSKNGSRNGSDDSANDSESETRQLTSKLVSQLSNQPTSSGESLSPNGDTGADDIEVRREKVIERYQILLKRKIRDIDIDCLDTWLDDYGLDDVLAAINIAIEHKPDKPDRYIGGILRQGIDSGKAKGLSGPAKCPPGCFSYEFSGKTYHISREHKDAFDSCRDTAIIRDMLSDWGKEVANV